jgi:hypothetical protein
MLNIMSFTKPHHRVLGTCSAFAVPRGQCDLRKNHRWRWCRPGNLHQSHRVYSESEENSDRSSRGGAVAIPEGLKTAGSVFVLAGFLKILIVCFPFSTMAVSMYFQGLFDLGTWAAIKMMPLAVGILALAKAIVDRKIHEKRWAPAMIAIGGILALMASRWAFARPRPSPLDPALAQYRRVKEHEEATRKREEERHGKRQLDPMMTDRAKALQSQSRFS